MLGLELLFIPLYIAYRIGRYAQTRVKPKPVLFYDYSTISANVIDRLNATHNLVPVDLSAGRTINEVVQVLHQ